MASRMYEVQTKVFSLLKGNENLGEMTNGVYDYVPEKTKTPYVTFGQITSLPSDTKTDDGEKVTVALEVWSESKGRKEAVMIMNEIESSLKEEIELDTAYLISQKVVSREVFEETYGLYHAIFEKEFSIGWDD